MDYREKYENGLECIQEILSGGADLIRISTLRKRLQPFFPELKKKESEDEQMIERLKSCVYASDITPEGREEILAWLEKQGEKSTNIDIDKMVMEYSQTKDGDFGLPVNCMIRAYRKGINDALSIALNIEKQGENNPTENIEIKFCEGDRVVSNQDGKVYIVGTAYYITGHNICLHDTDGNHLWTNRDDLNKNYHLWTITDAKDGDVLVYEDENFTIPFIAIYKCLGDTVCDYRGLKDVTFISHCFIGLNGNFHEGEGGHVIEGIHPGTKEQRDLFFQKMKEAGYEWDADNKKLKKNEQKPADKTEPKFNVRDWCIDKQDGTIFRIEKVMENTYDYKTDKGNVYSCTHDSLEFDSKLWTIADAKDGDVLVDEDNNIGLYLEEKDDLYWHSRIYLGCDGRLRGFSIGGYHNHENTKPATKEQRDMLFRKMKEAGYEWNSEKKELKKIEPKTFDPDNVIEWLTANVRLYASLNFLYGSDCPQGDVEVESLIKAFKKDFGL